MEQKQNTATPSEQRWTVSKIDELVKKLPAFKKNDGTLNLGGGITLSCTMIFAEFENENFTANEILDLIYAFNDCPPRKEAAKRYFIIQALFFAKRVPRLIFNGHSHDIYKSPPLTFSPIRDYFEKGSDINKAKIYGMLETGYIGIPRIVGKVQTGMCRCCNNHEVDKIETQKIVDIASISNLHLKEDGTLVISPQSD